MLLPLNFLETKTGHVLTVARRHQTAKQWTILLYVYHICQIGFIFVGLPNCGIQCYSTPWRIWSKAHDNLRSRALTREVSNSETLRRARFAQMARWPARIPEFVSSFCPSLKVWSRNRLKKTVMVFLQAHGFLESFRFLWQTQKNIHASGNGEMANSPPILISPAPWSNIIWLASGSFVLVVLALFFYLQKLRSQLGTRSWNLKTQHVSLHHGITTSTQNCNRIDPKDQQHVK